MVSSINENNPIAGSPTTQSVRDNFGAAKDEINKMLRMGEDVVVTTSPSVNTYIADFSNNVTLAEGLRICLRANTSNTTGTTTLNVDGTGARPVVNVDGSNLIGGQIGGATHYLDLMYNASTQNWILLNPAITTPTEADTLTNTRNIELTGAVTGNVNFDGSSDVSIATTAASSIGLLAYPVGAIYMSMVSTSPATLFGGTWSAFAPGKVLVGRDASDSDFNLAGETGGTKTHTLTVDEMPAHTHKENTVPERNDMFVDSSLTVTVPSTRSSDVDSGRTTGTTTFSTGGSQAHNNLQPYIVVYMWRRTA